MNSERKIQVIPKHEQVRRFLLERISNKDFGVGEVIPSEVRLSQEYGVSRITIRRALGQLVRDGIIQNAQGYGYTIGNSTPRPIIGLIYGEQMYGPEQLTGLHLMIRSLQALLTERNFNLKVYNVRAGGPEHLSDRAQLISHLRKGYLKGLISLAWPCSDEEDAELARADRELYAVIEQNLGLVCFGHLLPGGIWVDYGAMSYAGTRHFLDQGLSRVAVIYGPPFNSGSSSSLEGYRRAHQEKNLAMEPNFIVQLSTLSKPAGYAAFRTIWALPNRPQAIVILDDFVAQGVMTAVLDLGVKVPAELQLAALYNCDGQLFFPRPFVRLEVDPMELARMLVDRLFEKIKDPARSWEDVLYAPRVVTTDVKKDWMSIDLGGSIPADQRAPRSTFPRKEAPELV